LVVLVGLAGVRIQEANPFPAGRKGRGNFRKYSLNGNEPGLHKSVSIPGKK
jgi:hypothetical protein